MKDLNHYIIFVFSLLLITGCGRLMVEMMVSKEAKEEMAQTERELAAARYNSYNNFEVTHHESFEDGVGEYVYLNGTEINIVKNLKEYDIIEGGFDFKARRIYIGRLDPGIYLLKFYRQNRLKNKYYYDYKRIVINKSTITKRYSLTFGKSSGVISAVISQSVDDFNRDYGNSPYRDVLVKKGIDPQNDLQYYLKYVDEMYYKNRMDSAIKSTKINEINKYFNLFSTDKITADYLYNSCNELIKK